MASEQELELLIKVNSDTGQLEIVSEKLKGVKDSAENTSAGFLNLSKTAKELVTIFGVGFTANAVVSFFKDSIKAAEEEVLTLRRLTTTYGESTESVKQFLSSVQALTGFSDTQAAQSLERLATATRSFGEAQNATRLAMDITVATGRNLSEVTELLFGLINGNNRAVLQSKQAFGSLIETGMTTQEVMNVLIEKFGGTAEKAEGLTKETNKLKNEFEDLKKNIGQELNPVLTTLLGNINSLFEGIRRLRDAQREMDDSMFRKEPRMDDTFPNEKKTEETHRSLEQKEIEHQTRLGQIRTNAAKNEIKQSENRFAVLVGQNDAHIKATEEFMKKQNEIYVRAYNTIANGISVSIGSAFADIVVEGKKFEDAMVGIFKSIISIIIQTIVQLLVLKALKAAIGGPLGFFAAPGGAGVGSGLGSGTFGAPGSGLIVPGDSGGNRSINVTINTQSLDISAIDIVMRKIADEITKESPEGLRMARVITDLSGRNSRSAK